MSLENKFSNDNYFEECVVSSLILDSQFAEQMTEVLDLEYFNLEYLKKTTKILFDYYNKHKVFPSWKLCVSISNDIEDETIKQQILAFLFKVKNNIDVNDLFYAKEQSLEFCRKRSLMLSLEKSLDLIEDNKYDQIVGNIQKALQAGSERDVGHLYAEEFEKRIQVEEEVKKIIPTPYPEINNLLKRGGVPTKKLCVICSPTGVGKSHFLVDIGYHAATLGHNVVHYTLELDPFEIGSRYDSRASGIAPELHLKHKELIQSKFKEIPGHITIKLYSTATVNTIRNHLNKLRMNGRYPDLIIVDYADLMNSQNQGHERRLNEEAVYRELRALAIDLDITVWTASQTNREGSDVDIITKKHVAEAWGKITTSDLWITMSHKFMFVAKSRLGPDNKAFPVVIDTSLSKIEVLPADMSTETFAPDNSLDLLKEKFKTFQKNNFKNSEDIQ